MKALACFAAVAIATTAYAQTPKPISEAEYSRRVTAIAEELFNSEKKAAERWRSDARASEPGTDAGDAVDNVLYEDVISLLDDALNADPRNTHAHLMAAEVLRAKAREGEGAYDICYLVDARDQANAVIEGAARATAADFKRAKELVADIAHIPAGEIDGKESDCHDQDDDASAGSATVAEAH